MRPAAANLAESQSLKFKAAAAAAAEDKWLLLSTDEVGEAAEAAVEAADVQRLDALNEVRLLEMMAGASGLAEEPMVESFSDPCEPPELAPGKQEVIVVTEAAEDGVTVI